MGENSNSNVSNHLLEVADKYNLAHKHLVQLIIRHGILQAQYFCKKFIHYAEVYLLGGSTITQPDDGQEKILLEKLLIAINSALIPLSLRLVQADDEYDDENSYIVLLSDRRPNDLLRNAFGLTLNDFTLFHLWIDAICNSENGEISKYDALAIASSLLTKGRKINGEYLLQYFVANKWLAMDNNKTTIHLDTRGIAELEDYFNLHANELKLNKCTVCGKFIVMKNRAICCETCESFTHRQCGLKIVRSVRAEKVLCPGKLRSGEVCTATFHIPIGVESVNQNQKDNRKRRIHCDSDAIDDYDATNSSMEEMFDAEV